MTSSRSVDASSWSLFVSHLAVWCVHHIIVSPLKNVVGFLSNQNYTLPPLSFIAHNQNGHRKIVQPSFRPSQREHLTLFNKCVTRRSFYQIPGKSSAPNRSSMYSERCIIRLIKKMFQFILKVSAFCHFESECESVKILQTGTMTNQMTVDGQICWKIARLLPAYEHILRKNLIRLSFFGSQFNFFCVLVRARCCCLDRKANHTGDRV